MYKQKYVEFSNLLSQLENKDNQQYYNGKTNFWEIRYQIKGFYDPRRESLFFDTK